MANKLNDDELENVQGGEVIIDNSAPDKDKLYRCNGCLKKFKTVYVFEGKNYCKTCYDKKTKKLNNLLGSI